jgi:hypothetical protein
VLGGHAVMAVGYEDAAQRFIVRNSWGEKMGPGGLFHDALRLSSELRAVLRLLDHPDGGIDEPRRMRPNISSGDSIGAHAPSPHPHAKEGIPPSSTTPHIPEGFGSGGG